MGKCQIDGNQTTNQIIFINGCLKGLVLAETIALTDEVMSYSLFQNPIILI